MPEESKLGEAILFLSTDQKELIKGLADAKQAAAGAQDKFSEVQGDLKEKFAQKFEHIGVHTFGTQLLGIVGINHQVGPIINLMKLGINSLAAAFGLATGPIGLVVFGLGALAAVSYKAYDGHVKHAEAAAKAKEKLEELTKSLVGFLQTQEKVTAEGRKVAGIAMEQTAEKMRELNRQIKEQEQKLQESNKAMKEVSSTAISYSANLGSVAKTQNDIARESLAASEAQVKAQTPIRMQLVLLQGQLQEVGKEYNKLKSLAAGHSEAEEKAGNKASETASKRIAALNQFADYKEMMEAKINSLAAEADTTELGRINRHFDDVGAMINRSSEHEKRVISESVLDETEKAQQTKTVIQLSEQAKANAVIAKNARIMASNRQAFGLEATAGEGLRNAVIGTANAMASKWSSAISALIVDGERWRGSFVDVIKDIARSFIQAVIQMMIQWAALMALTGGTGSFGSGVLGGIGKLFGGKASGGPVSRGTPYMVGEVGPELFVPQESGNIIPNDKMGGMGGSMTVNQNFSITGLDFSHDSTIARVGAALANAARRGVSEVTNLGITLQRSADLNVGRAY